MAVRSEGVASDTVKANDKVEKRVRDLNREMLRLSVAERRRRWTEYYARLAKLRADGNGPKG